MEKETLVINLFGGPGSGKSTGAAYIFAQLKMLKVDVEYVSEFAKDKVWEGNSEVFKCQEYIFGKQSFKMSRCKGKVDVIITDCPILLSAFYNKNLSENFNKTVLEVFNSYNNLNFFINRTKAYNPNGRFQTEEESDIISQDLKNLLKKYKIPWRNENGHINGYDDILRMIFLVLEDNK